VPSLSPQRLIREAIALLAITAIGLLGIEVLLRGAYLVRNATVRTIPLPYVIGHDYGPQPPWVDDLRILVPDPDLIWRARPHVHRRYMDVFSPADRDEDRYGLIRQFIPRIPPALRANPTWEIALNAAGFRDQELPPAPSPGAFRIVCIGDSWTFGANVGADAAYPRRLAALLGASYPGRTFEVLNLGVLGYTSFQGRRLLEGVALDLEPDLVIAGYAMNDADVAGYRDRDVTGSPGKERRTLAGALAASEIYKLLQYFAELTRYEPKTLGDNLEAKAAAAPGAATAVDYSELEAWTRVSPADYEENMRAIVERTRRADASIVLLFNELWTESPYRNVLERLAVAEEVPFIDSSRLLAAARSDAEKDLSVRLGLDSGGSPAPPRGEDGRIEVVFRVFAGDHAVPRALFIVGARPELGNLEPNALAMHDDGTGGDERAGDCVWSLTARLEPGARIAYVYTNSGTRGEWEGLDVPCVRQLTVSAPDSIGRVIRPIETFGAIAMQADSWHPDAAGYDLIARAVVAALRTDSRFMAFIGDTVTATPDAGTVDGR
jgi:lysophospholipase L1-like esterase